MKRLAAILLTAILLFSTTSCDYISDKLNKLYSFDNSESTVTTVNKPDKSNSDTDETEDSSINDKNESDSAIADFSSYEAIIDTYRSIVNCFQNYTNEEYMRHEIASTVAFQNSESEEIYTKLFFSAYYHYSFDYVDEYFKDGRNYFGYATYDINGNGSDELILLNDHYAIIAIFTNRGGKPQLIIDNQPECRIDGEGRIYTQECVNEVNEYFPNFDWYYTVKVHELNEHDELVVVEEYQAINPHNDQGYSFYVDLTQGEGVEISHEEFVSKTHGCSELSNAPIITKSSVDLKFVRLFSTLKPYIPEINSIHWYQYEGRGREVYINHLTEESVGIGFLSSASQLNGAPYVTATRSGERAYFEDESICGYLEFGLDGVWLVISESQVDAFPCGAYHFTKYVIYKG